MREQMVRPGAGIDPVRLGMGLTEARAALAVLGHVSDFRRTDEDPQGLVVSADGQDIFVYPDSDRQVVIAVEVSAGDDVTVLLDGRDVFRTPAADLIRWLSSRYDVTESEEGCSYDVVGLGLGLWRSCVPDDDDNGDGRLFESVIVQEKPTPQAHATAVAQSAGAGPSCRPTARSPSASAILSRAWVSPPSKHLA